MLRDNRNSTQRFNKYNISKKDKNFRNGAAKKVVQISEESPTIVTEGKKSRPQSAQVQRPRSQSLPRRPRSAQISPEGHPKVRDHTEHQDLIASFNRSLRLLGLQLGELESANIPSHRKPNRVDGPSFHTRLHSRTSVSLDNVRSCALHGDVEHRRYLASAVYQEWYFSKLRLERERREQESRQRELEESCREKRKAELQSRAEENFMIWKCRKDREAAVSRERQRERQAQMEKLRSDAAKIQQALEDWNKHKAVQLRKAGKAKRDKEKKEAEKKLKEEQEKQQHAREAYASWQKKTIQLQQRKAEREMKAREAAERSKEKMLQRKMEAAECFTSWKSGKDKQLRNKMRQIKAMNNQSATQRGQWVAERMYEAEQAYQDWLESIEDRSNHSSSHPLSPSPIRHWN